MTVKHLIENLKGFNPDSQVKLHHFTGDNLLFVCSVKGNEETVYLEGNSDVDLASEIKQYLETAADEEWEEQDVFTGLYEHGITVKDMRDCLGTESSEWYEHGLKYYGLM